MTDGPPSKSNDHAQGLRSRSEGPAYLASRLISSYIGYVLVMGVLALAVPKFEIVFQKFNLHLPAITIALLLASRLCTHFYLWAFLLPVPAVWALVNVRIKNIERRRRIRVWAFILVAAFLVFTLIALFLPMAHLLRSPPPSQQ